MGGGTTANTCSGLARLGLHPSFISNCGNDSIGRKLKAELEQDGADVFDELYKMQVKRFDTFDAAKWQELKVKAFKDLTFIFDDLNW